MVQTRGRRRYNRRKNRILFFPRLLVLLTLAAVTIVIPLSGFVNANRANSLTAHLVGMSGGESWAYLSTNPQNSGQAQALEQDSAASTRARVAKIPANCDIKNVGTGSAMVNGEKKEPIIFPLAKGTFVKTSPFGIRVHPLSHISMLHEGTDYSTNAGAPIYALTKGKVSKIGSGGYRGNHVFIEHDVNGEKFISTYNHMLDGSIIVKEGEWVEAGQRIGSVGSTGASTGPHLHLEILYPTEKDPHDPAAWLDEHGYVFLGEECR